MFYTLLPKSQWLFAAIALLFAALVRWMVALGPYSGAGTPPMYGDYEAQRHWMELTLHVPIKEWYTHDLSWWGLDYPPLTAYVSWICGVVGQVIKPKWFALYDSRGYEDAESKFFMRSTVMACEMIFYIPALVYYFKRVVKGYSLKQQDYMLMIALLQPALIIIDHGHFQYNAVMLGLSLCAINCLATHRFITAAVLFSLSLMFKQMALYFAMPIFAFLLSQCFRQQNGFHLFVKLGIAVVATFGACLYPWVFPVSDLLQVAHRVFPIARGLYEDKVANVWCALSVILKLKSLLSVERCVQISLAMTFAGLLPSCIDLFQKPTHQKLIYALANCSLAFFLFSFQVHEKTILLPALPILLLLPIEWDAVILFQNWAMFSMFPLLSREKLQLQYFSVFVLWNWLQQQTRPSTSGSSVTRMLHAASFTVMAIWYVLQVSTPPPPRFPDLYTVTNCILSCMVFCLFYLYLHYRQFTLAALCSRLADVGVNLTDPVFRGVYRGKTLHADDFSLVMQRAKAAGVERQIVTGGSLHESKEALSLANTDNTLYSTVGCHPTRTSEIEKFKGGAQAYYDSLLGIITESRKTGKNKVVAVGECGLDYDRLHFSAKETQLKHFGLHFRLARETGLPLFLHNRNTGGDFVQQIKANRDSFSNGVVHSFTGSVEEMKELVVLGLYIGINGCSLKTAENLEVVKQIPLDRLMLETDAPWCDIRPTHDSHKHTTNIAGTEQALYKPASKKPERFEMGSTVKGRNEPCSIGLIAHAVAAVRGENVETVAEAAYENTIRVFFSH